MSTRDFSTLVNEISPSVPGCPYPMILSHIRSAAIRTCERTLAWRYQVPTFPLQPNVQQYTYSKPEGTDVHAVFDAYVNNKPLQRLTLDQMIGKLRRENGGLYNLLLENGGAFLNENGTEFLGDGADTFETGEPAAMYQVTPDKFAVYPIPDDQRSYEVVMFLALKPKRDADGMDSVIFDELQDVIIHGALQHLLVMPNKNWMDRELASYHAKQYIFHLSERRARANLGTVRGVMTAVMQPFGA